MDSEVQIDFEFQASSAQGFNKDGIVLFDNERLCGNGKNFHNSTNDLTNIFPNGASSLIIQEGLWDLFTEVNYLGNPVRVENSTKFGPVFIIYKMPDDKK